MPGKHWLKKHHQILSASVGVLASSMAGYFIEPIFLLAIGLNGVMIWNVLRTSGFRPPRRFLPALITLSIFVTGVGAGKVADSIIASKFTVPTFRPVFVWKPTSYTGKILSVAVPRGSLVGGVILEMLLIHDTPLENESFAVSDSSYPLKQQFFLDIYNASAGLPIVKSYPSVIMQGELVCLSGNCINPVGNQL